MLTFRSPAPCRRRRRTHNPTLFTPFTPHSLCAQLVDWLPGRRRFINPTLFTPMHTPHAHGGGASPAAWQRHHRSDAHPPGLFTPVHTLTTHTKNAHGGSVQPSSLANATPISDAHPPALFKPVHPPTPHTHMAAVRSPAPWQTRHRSGSSCGTAACR